MTQSLLTEFLEGYVARVNGQTAVDCPYYVTSDCADAWHAGLQFDIDESNGRVSGLIDVRVWHGRGYSVNVAGTAEGGQKVKHLYKIDWIGRTARTRLVCYGSEGR